MSTQIDCLLIGHNQVPFLEYEKTVRELGPDSGAYADLKSNFIRCNNRSYSASEVFNLFCARDGEPIDMVASFNAAIAYLGTYLDRRGFTFDFVNDFQAEKEDLAQKLTGGGIMCAAITTTLYVAPFPIIEIVRFIRDLRPGMKIIVGGPFVSTKTRVLTPQQLDYLFDLMGADVYVNSAQGEAALVNLLEAFKAGAPLDRVNNIYYKLPGEESYCSTPMVREDNRLAENMADWGLFSGRTGPFVNIRTSISCPFCCSFCGFPERAGQYQTVPVEVIESEMKRLRRLPAVKLVNFIDDTLNVPVKRFKEMLRMMIRNKFSFKWLSHFRCQFADRETVELMKESGCEGVFLGIESGSDVILKNMNKKASIAKYLEGVRLLKEYGIITFGSFIIGFPGETEETVRETTTFIRESGLDFYRSQLWYCESITPICREKETYGISGENFEWSHNTMDSRRARQIIHDMIMSIGHPIRVPQYYFDFENVIQLPHKGHDIPKVKEFLKAFNRGVTEKLSGLPGRETGYGVITALQNAGNNNLENKPDSGQLVDNTTDLDQKYNLKFEF
jgi:radical SAM PhpK family P-methyltransferase